MPLPVLEAMQRDLLDYQGKGLSVMEMSHRSDEFGEIAHRAEIDLRTLMGIPEHYRVLFMQGGASAQFALTVQNLDINGRVNFAKTGYWSEKAMNVAGALSRVREIASCVTDPSIRIALDEHWPVESDASYLHLTHNETIDGIRFKQLPECEIPLVVDMSSSILSQPVDIERYALIYAGAQKNIGPAGVTVVIVRDDLLDRSLCNKVLPSVFSYAAMAKAGSMLNTPPCFAWYAAGLVFQWLREQGGLQQMGERNEAKAAKVYQIIDQYDCYVNHVHPDNRSIMNIPFQLNGRDLSSFLEGARERHLIGLKGHKSVGGIRVSLYNAVPDEAVNQLTDYLIEFAEQ